MATKQEKLIKWASSLGYPSHNRNVLVVIRCIDQTRDCLRDTPIGNISITKQILGILDANNEYHKVPTFEDDKPFDVREFTEADRLERDAISDFAISGHLINAMTGLMRWTKDQISKAIEAEKKLNK